jgi:hypothetical protein
MKTTIDTKTAGGASGGSRHAIQPSTVPHTLAHTTTKPSNGVDGKASSIKRDTDRNLLDGLPPFSTVREFAVFAHVHPRTISRDLEDGLLIAHAFRGARRISREDGLAYLRKTRGKIGERQRRRSPRKPTRQTAPAEPETP